MSKEGASDKQIFPLPSKTPSGAFDPEIFITPFNRDSISNIPEFISSENKENGVVVGGGGGGLIGENFLGGTFGIGNGSSLIDAKDKYGGVPGSMRTYSLGLKALANKTPMMREISQSSTVDSVFSHVEGETLDMNCPGEVGSPIVQASKPIGIKTKYIHPHLNPTIGDDQITNSAPQIINMYSYKPIDGKDEPLSCTSLPDKIACEKTANAMMAAVLEGDTDTNDELAALPPLPPLPPTLPHLPPMHPLGTLPNGHFQHQNLPLIHELHEQQQPPQPPLPPPPPPSHEYQLQHQHSHQQQMFWSSQFEKVQNGSLDGSTGDIASNQINVLFKTELCRSWQYGTCRYSERCLFAHGEQELRPYIRPRHNKYKTEPCFTFHKFGFCPYGIRCNFVHDATEHRQAKHSVPSLYKTRLCRTYMERGSCPYGEKCDFAHGPDDLSYDITKHPKYRTKMCRTFLETGVCVYGDRCSFSHLYGGKRENGKRNGNGNGAGANGGAPPGGNGGGRRRPFDIDEEDPENVDQSLTNKLTKLNLPIAENQPDYDITPTNTPRNNKNTYKRRKNYARNGKQNKLDENETPKAEKRASKRG